MAKGFRPVDRDQRFLLPPDMREWLPADHLVWFVLDAVEGLDLAGFRARYKLGRAGRAAFDPKMMLTLLIYAYAVGQRSSRQIERLCDVDVAFRLICAQDAPDHATIARFRAGHEQSLGDLFTEILALCARAGMGRLGTVALDGTKIAADAALSANRSESRLREMAADILAEAGEVDADEDELFGTTRGDELAEELSDPAGRAARIKAILAEIAAERRARAEASQRAGTAQSRVHAAEQNLQTTAERLTAQAAARAEAEAATAAAGGTIPGTRPVPVEQHCRFRDAAQRLDRAKAAAVAARQPPPPPPPGSAKETKRNLTDPDSRIMKTRKGWEQAYNGQLVVSSDYLILAAVLTNDPADVTLYQPMIAATAATIAEINTITGRDWQIGCVLADAGYASNDNLTAEGPERLIALGARRDLDKAANLEPAHGDPPQDTDARQRMSHRLRTPEGAALYRQRAATVEPVNAHLKDRRALRRFSRRGLPAAHSEFRFAAAVTNLLRIRTHLAAKPA